MLALPPPPDPAVVDGVAPDDDAGVAADVDVVAVPAVLVELAGEVDAAFELLPQPTTVTIATTASAVAQRRVKLPEQTVTLAPRRP